MDQCAGATAPRGISVSQEGGAVTVRLAGEIDADLREHASRCMVAVLDADGPVVVDTSAVTFIDSSGLAFLLQLQGVLGGTGRDLLLRDPSRAVLDLLAMVGLDTLFVTGPSRERAGEV